MGHREPRSKIDIDILHGVNDLRCQMQVLRNEIAMMHQILNILTEGAARLVVPVSQPIDQPTQEE
jgi:hypothetical protein